ncbi:hypothetical protein KGA65_07605 [Ideonella sp. B7]|uniref:hypothetical protein n=1 Tax=Ideonella benzenivorans TaxID=2831643 RepID=UPI001CECED9F|nr:hypothetical protein [Ideonella benzenivorans]MCA6216402.1 hypothetical protein [Ideonella benzenivorans]
MLESEKLAVAAHLHVVMRRKIGRVTDVEWMIRSPEYAREVIRLALAEAAHPELVEWGQRLQAVLFPALAAPGAAPAAASDKGPHSGFEDSRLGRTAARPASARYVSSLR